MSMECEISTDDIRFWDDDKDLDMNEVTVAVKFIQDNFPEANISSGHYVDRGVVVFDLNIRGTEAQAENLSYEIQDALDSLTGS